MKAKYFGTDGIRGVANDSVLAPLFLTKLGQALGTYFKPEGHRPKIIIGKDTRSSGYMIENAIAAGLSSAGADVLLAGPIPTPAVSLLTKSMRADAGIMISASHNPYYDNGIKLFDADGAKLSDEVQNAIEALLESGKFKQAEPQFLGQMKRVDDAGGRYIEYLKSTLPKNTRFDGLNLVIDCAHGAAYKIAPTIFSELGAKVTTIGTKPNGININDNCGATSLDRLSLKVKETKADLGIALDGDADRCMLVDERGEVIDGDQIMGFMGRFLKEKSELCGSAVVATVMSNLGLENFLKNINVKLIRAKVGDRYVSEALLDGGFSLGGEQSGHILFPNITMAGDGILTALQVLSAWGEYGFKPASKNIRVFTPYPQVLKNVRANTNILSNQEMAEKIAEVSRELEAKNGRMLVRPSGTEPLIRVMTEGDDQGFIEKCAQEVVDYINKIA